MLSKNKDVQRYIVTCATDKFAQTTATQAVILTLLSGVLIGAASAAYEQLLGIPNPMGALRFGGSPEVAAERFGANTIWMLLLVAPLFEELAFRLALSFRRAHVAIGAGALAAFLAMRLAPAGSFFGGWGGAAVVAVAAAGLLYGCSPAGFWSSKRAAWQVAVFTATCEGMWSLIPANPTGAARKGVTG